MPAQTGHAKFSLPPSRDSENSGNYSMYIEPVFLVLQVWLLLVWELQVTK